jgi:hypothetical protein
VGRDGCGARPPARRAGAAGAQDPGPRAPIRRPARVRRPARATDRGAHDLGRRDDGRRDDGGGMRGRAGSRPASSASWPVGRMPAHTTRLLLRLRLALTVGPPAAAPLLLSIT